MSYFDRPEWSNSQLTELYSKLNGTGFYSSSGISPVNAAFGRLMHVGIFEPHLWEEELTQAQRVLLKSEIRQCERMIAAIRGSQTIKIFLNNPASLFEQEAYFELHGVPFRMKADALLKPFCGDAKSTQARSLKDFVKSCEQFGYFRQAIVYRAGTGCDHHLIWGVTKKEPHEVFYIDCAEYQTEMLRAEAQVYELCSYIKRNNLIRKP